MYHDTEIVKILLRLEKKLEDYTNIIKNIKKKPDIIQQHEAGLCYYAKIKMSTEIILNELCSLILGKIYYKGILEDIDNKG